MVFSPDLGGKNGGVLSMRMQVILDSPFARPGSAPMWGAGRKESSGTGLGEKGTASGRTVYGMREVLTPCPHCLKWAVLVAVWSP